MKYFQQATKEELSFTALATQAHEEILDNYLRVIDLDFGGDREATNTLVCDMIDLFIGIDNPFIERCGRTLSTFLRTDIFDMLRQRVAQRPGWTPQLAQQKSEEG